MTAHYCEIGWLKFSALDALREDLPIVRPGEVEQAERELREHVKACPVCRERVGERAGITK